MPRLDIPTTCARPRTTLSSRAFHDARRRLAAGAAIALTILTALALAQSAAAARFPNPVVAPPNSIYDPGLFVQKYAGVNLYFAASGGADREGMMPIWGTADRRTWSSTRRIIRAGHRPSWLQRGGSPQLYLFPGKFVAYFGAAVTGRTRQCVGRAESAVLDDFNGNVPGAYLCEPGDRYSIIDPSVFTDADGKRYLLYKDNLNAAGLGDSRLVVRSMGASGSLDRSNLGAPAHVLTAAPALGEGHSVEAPTLVRNPRDGLYYMFYSSGTYNQDTYMVRVARARSPLGPYTRSPYNPVVQAKTDAKFCGSGHQDVTYTSQEGWLMYYHAYLGQSGSSCTGARYLMMDQLHWDRPGGWPRVHDGTPSG